MWINLKLYTAYYPKNKHCAAFLRMLVFNNFGLIVTIFSEWTKLSLYVINVKLLMHSILHLMGGDFELIRLLVQYQPCGNYANCKYWCYFVFHYSNFSIKASRVKTFGLSTVLLNHQSTSAILLHALVCYLIHLQSRYSWLL